MALKRDEAPMALLQPPATVPYCENPAMVL